MNPFNNVIYNPRDFDPDFISRDRPIGRHRRRAGRAKGGRPMIRVNLLAARPADQEEEGRWRRRQCPVRPGQRVQAYLLLGLFTRRHDRARAPPLWW